MRAIHLSDCDCGVAGHPPAIWHAASMVQIGIIGAGTVAIAFARYLISSGHRVLISSSRSPSQLDEVVKTLGEGVTAVAPQVAAAEPVVLLAVPWEKVEQALSDLPAWNGRILIDATNQFLSDGTVQDLHGDVSSELVAAFAPGARVVKALNNFFMKRFEDGPDVGAAKRVAFVSGDDGEAKHLVGSLFKTFGFVVIDLGGIHDGGRLQQVGGPFAGVDILQG
jgi:8-hydroxy-5-deazaflavin:NADPH oxidoreductase